MRGVFALGLLALAAGCGCDSPSDLPPVQCQAFTNLTCGRVAECSATLTVRQCEKDFGQTLDCSRAVAVSDTFGECIGAVEKATCEELTRADGALVLPAACARAIILEAS